LMDINNFEKLVDRAFAELPEKMVSHERFEVPRLYSMVQGNVTLIKNIVEISDKLHRSAEMIAKFYSKELATPAVMKNNQLQITGKFMDRALNERLNSFVKHYVLCSQCQKPDTKLVDIQHVKTLVCDSCGARMAVRAT